MARCSDPAFRLPGSCGRRRHRYRALSKTGNLVRQDGDERERCGEDKRARHEGRDQQHEGPCDAEWLCCLNVQGPFPVAAPACITAELSPTFRNVVAEQGLDTAGVRPPPVASSTAAVPLRVGCAERRSRDARPRIEPESGRSRAPRRRRRSLARRGPNGTPNRPIGRQSASTDCNFGRGP